MALAGSRESSRGRRGVCCKLKNTEGPGAKEMINAFLKHGEEGMVVTMVVLYTPNGWREGVVVTLPKKGDNAAPSNH